MKNKIIIALILFCATQSFLKGQNIAGYEYWLDRDIENKVATTSSNENISLTVDVSLLSEGIHCYNFRAKDSEGYWSAPLTQYFYRVPLNPKNNKLVKYEYWFDKNVESKQIVTSESEIINLDLDVSSLLSGIHYFNFRAQDAYGHWSAPLTQYFYKPFLSDNSNANIVTCEYWFDKNYSSKQVVNYSSDIVSLDVSALEDGLHRLNYHAKDNKGRWTQPMTSVFIKTGSSYVEPEIHFNNGYMYQIFDFPITWREAQDLCERLGGNLAIINVEEDQEFIKSIFTDKTESNYYWLGGNEGAVNKNWNKQQTDNDLTSKIASGFVFQGRLSEVGILEVILPKQDNIASYKNLTLELKNKDSGQLFSITTTDKDKYTYNSIPTGNYQLILKNKYGSILGQIDNIVVKKENVSVEFNSLESIYSVQLNITGINGQKVMTKPTIKWFDQNDVFISAEDTIKGVAAGMKLKYQLNFTEELGKVYALPQLQDYNVIAGNNTIQLELQPISLITLQGLVKSKDKGILSDATVSVLQMLNKKYSRIATTKTNREGKFSLEIYNDSSSIVISYPDYVDQTIAKTNFNVGADLGLITLEPINGVRITLDYTYTASSLQGETPSIESWYSNYQNVDYVLYNLTKETPITNFVVQYSEIVLLETIDIGDQIQITATSRVKEFEPVKNVIVVDETLKTTTRLDIVQHGFIKATYTDSGNTSNIGILYDSAGHYVNRFAYSGKAFTTGGLFDGTYQLVSMAKSQFFNSILNLSAFSAIGLEPGAHYALQTVVVESGKITEVTIPTIPQLDESKFYYTGTNTMFSVNKTSIVAGNYLTLRSEINFKNEHRSNVSNVKLIVDIPEGCSFVANSVLIGNIMSNGYNINDNQLTIPLNNYSDIVRFCVIPTKGGYYTPNGFVEFELEGKTIRQPIGTAKFTVNDLSIIVPSITTQNKLIVSGVAMAKTEIRVYDNDVLIGQTQALANGSWSAVCELYKPYALSFHNIYAKAVTPQGISIQSETRKLTHNINAIEVSKVTMINVAHPATSLDLCEYVTEFNFLHPLTVAPIYWYWPSYPDFTFKIEFTDNNPELLSNVNLYVKTTSGSVVELPATYDKDKDIWLATGKFYSGNLPKDVSVDYLSNEEIYLDREYLKDFKEQYDILCKELKFGIEVINGSKNEYSQAVIDSLSIALGIIDLPQSDFDKEAYMKYLNSLSNNELQVIIDSLEDSSFDMEMYLKRIESFFSSEKYFDIELLDGTKVQSKSCEGITDIYLISSGYAEYKTTEGNSIYVINTEQESGYVDFSNNIYFLIQTPIASTLRSISANGDSFSSRIYGALSKIQGVYSDLQNQIGNLVQGLTLELTKATEIFDKTNSLYELKSIKLSVLEDELYSGLLDPWQFNAKQAEVQALKSEVSQLKLAVGKTNTQKLTAAACLKSAKPLGATLSKILPITNYIILANEAINDYRHVGNLANLLPSIKCPEFENEVIACGMAIDQMKTKVASYYFVKFEVQLMMDFSAAFEIVGAPATGGTSLVPAFATILGKMALEVTVDIIYKRKLNNAITNMEGRLYLLDYQINQSKCNNNDGGDGGGGSGGDGGGSGGDGGGSGGGSSGNGEGGSENGIGAGSGSSGGTNTSGSRSQTGTSGSTPAIELEDPSGFVYESVPSNPLSGVTASIYYKTEEENMYGERIEKVVLWDAENYYQINPQITNQYGIYAWDVPQGLWQVKFEKEGYQTTYSDWLPVPPPQLDINIPMVQSTQPSVKAVHGCESGIEIEFDKFMQPATLTTDSIRVTKNGESILGMIDMLNAETNPVSNEHFVLKVRFIPQSPFNITDEVYLTVNHQVKSYAGINMVEDFMQRVEIQKETKSIVATPVLNLAYNGKDYIDVSVEPQEAAANKKVIAKVISSSIATVDNDVILNHEGKAKIQVKAELPGSTQIFISVEGTDLRIMTTVNVAKPLEKLKSPTASISSGSTVEKGQLISLYSTQSGTSIYYTVDGSDPTVSSVRILYTEPIVINEDIIIQAIATKEGMSDSDVASFIYGVKKDSEISGVRNLRTLFITQQDDDVLIASDKIIKQVDIITIMGQLYSRHIVGLFSTKMKVNNGVYIIRVTYSDGGLETRKIIVR